MSFTVWALGCLYFGVAGFYLARLELMCPHKCHPIAHALQVAIWPVYVLLTLLSSDDRGGDDRGKPA